MAFVFAKFSFKVTKGIFFLVVAGMMIPIHTTLIPIYSLSINIGVYDTLFALIGPYISFNISCFGLHHDPVLQGDAQRA
jgi:raffinose/stachyose/melibiose transport system permease protein